MSGPALPADQRHLDDSNEGCLSVPGAYMELDRPDYAVVRGQDPQALQRHRAQLFELEARVREHAREMRRQVRAAEVQGLLDDFIAAHERLGQGYHSALEGFVRSGGKDFATADALVRGQDRPPTDVVDRITEELGRRAEEVGAAQAATVTSPST